MTGAIGDTASDRGRVDPAFASILSRGFDIAALDRHQSTVVALWPDFRIAYLNPAWDMFAERNRGVPSVRERWDLGATYLDAIALPLRPFYHQLISTAPDPGATLHPVTHDYECSSPSTYRLHTLQVFALRDRAGSLLIHSSRIERPHTDPVVEPTSPGMYVGDDGLSRQCSHCRRVENVDIPGRWDWIPQWVSSQPDHISHSICPPCFEHYYGTASNWV